MRTYALLSNDKHYTNEPSFERIIDYIVYQWFFDDMKRYYHVIIEETEELVATICPGPNKEIIVTRLLPTLTIQIMNLFKHLDTGLLHYESNMALISLPPQATENSKLY